MVFKIGSHIFIWVVWVMIVTNLLNIFINKSCSGFIQLLVIFGIIVVTTQLSIISIKFINKNLKK
jgi:hypothetical protein